MSVLAVAGTAAVAGCGGSSSQSQSQSQTAATQSPAARSSAPVTSFSSAQLKAALLDEVNGSKPASSAESGNYGSLPDVQTNKHTMDAVTVSPAKCAAASQTGFNSAAFTDAPASVVTFNVGNDGVSEVLVSASPQAADIALSSTLPSGCEHYSATVDGKTYRYSVTESALAGVAQQARALNVQAAGDASVDVWSVLYRGTGFVGAVTMVGPDATEAAVKNLAQTAYARASQSLASS